MGSRSTGGSSVNGFESSHQHGMVVAVSIRHTKKHATDIESHLTMDTTISASSSKYVCPFLRNCLNFP